VPVARGVGLRASAGRSVERAATHPGWRHLRTTALAQRPLGAVDSRGSRLACRSCVAVTAAGAGRWGHGLGARQPERLRLAGADVGGHDLRLGFPTAPWRPPRHGRLSGSASNGPCRAGFPAELPVDQEFDQRVHLQSRRQAACRPTSISPLHPHPNPPSGGGAHVWRQSWFKRFRRTHVISLSGPDAGVCACIGGLTTPGRLTRWRVHPLAVGC